MPWSHCKNEFLLDDEPCETCGISKAEWTVQVDKTRVLKLGIKRPPKVATTWVEVALRDADGLPVGGEPFVLLTPDGRRREGTLDEAGRARVEGIPAGDCQVSFPQRQPWQPATERWVEVSLRHPDGRPVAGERFQVHVAGRLLHEGTLGPDGRARVEGIPSDHCQVVFPDRAGEAWGPPRPAPPPPPRRRRTRAFDIVLTHEGAPVPYEPYRVTLPDGACLEGVLDGSGRARVTGVDADRCQVSFPERDGAAWGERRPEARRPLELVLTERGAPVPYEPYVVTLPDGTRLEGALDALGRARLEGLDADRCQVSFPERDAGAITPRAR